MEKVKSGYLRVATPSGIGYICVAVETLPKGVVGEYRAAFAFCSPKDRFDRKRAYRMARGRLDVWNCVEGSKLVHWIGSCDSITSSFLVAVKTAIDTGIAPGWLVRASKSNNMYLGLNQNNKSFCLNDIFNSENKRAAE